MIISQVVSVKRKTIPVNQAIINDEIAASQFQSQPKDLNGKKGSFSSSSSSYTTSSHRTFRDSSSSTTTTPTTTRTMTMTPTTTAAHSDDEVLSSLSSTSGFYVFQKDFMTYFQQCFCTELQ